MDNFISLKKIDFKYIILISGSIVTNFILYFSFILFENNKKKYIDNYKENNKILKSFLKYFGCFSFIIGEIIRKKFYFKKDNTSSVNLVKLKDIFIIIAVSLINLFDEFLAIYLKIKTNTSISRDERYNSINFIFLFICSIFIFKKGYYNHQYISIILIIAIEISRYFFNLKDNNDKKEERKMNSFKEFLFQILRALLESIFNGYSKFLMDLKFFSPFKATYIFGLINLLIVIIIYMILSYITVDENKSYCYVKYNNDCYIDKFYNIFTNFTFIQFLGLFFYSIVIGILKVLFDFIVRDYTMCHIYLYYQFIVIYSFFKKKNNDTLSISINIVSIVIELLITLVFLEIIELKFCGLNKNIKENIEKRAMLDIVEKDSNDNNSVLSGVYSDENYITNFKELKELSQENLFINQNES